MSQIVLSQINVYPLKSAGGLSLPVAELTPMGLEHDRRWMLVDASGRFISQREQPRMALLRVAFDDSALVVRAPGMTPMRLALRPDGGERVTVRVWGDELQAVLMHAGDHEWFSDFLGMPCRLVYIPDDIRRPVDPDYAQAADRVGFADGFPFLLISEASLEDLNARLEHPLPMNRFRPNLVVAGCEPYAEDAWRCIRIGGITFRVVKPCARCAITTTDQDTAGVGKEPLRTLATYRRVGKKVLFGQNLIHDGLGTLRVGDAVLI